MSRRKVVRQPDDSMDVFKGFRWVECYVDVAVNPRTKSEVTFTPPVRIGCFEDFAKFYDEWENFCSRDLNGLDPAEVCFQLS